MEGWKDEVVVMDNASKLALSLTSREKVFPDAKVRFSRATLSAMSSLVSSAMVQNHCTRGMKWIEMEEGGGWRRKGVEEWPIPLLPASFPLLPSAYSLTVAPFLPFCILKKSFLHVLSFCEASGMQKHGEWCLHYLITFRPRPGVP